MKRLLVLFVVLVPLSLVIVGCGQGGGSSKVSPGDPKKVGTKIADEELMNKMKAEMKAKGMPGAPRGGAGLPGAPGQGGPK
jgi:hypothetical protein